MKRTYLALAGLALAISTLPSSLPPQARAASLFDSQELETSRFAVLAQPVADADWNLVVLEQLAPEPLCWQPREDGLIDPSLIRFDFTGICSRYLDSNGYSLRVGGDDLGTSHRLAIRRVGGELQLQAFSPDEEMILVVGRGTLQRRDRAGFVALQLEPGWELRRRVYESQALNHIYFQHEGALEELLAEARRSSEPDADGSRLSSASMPGSRRSRLDRALSRVEAEPTARADSDASEATGSDLTASEGATADATGPDLSLPIGVSRGRRIAMGDASAIPLQVIPYQE